ncbi:sigma-E processing peptidase SpoIIGA [Sporomusa sp.]|uniref:sigma-E processing peptidase SpoIIGA n=1 Tax=Sporomusa sp. TaxID=2078658 RepID=UPI002B75DC80|nr:sigma-E processing peptidase SpoIIGA [Sporomusa sp.]HWR43265.1 sigma-E processing peptidase SpoIIGA [Sporomusa sp.]
MYIYADMVLLINFIMNSVILVLTANAAGVPFSWKRILPTALMGGVYSLAGIFPEMAILYTIPGKLLASVTLILLAFGRRPLKITLILVGIFFIISFILGGAVLGWLYFVQTGAPHGVSHIIGLSWGNLAIGSVIAVTLILLIVKQMLGRMYRRQTLYQAKIEYDGRYAEITGMLDTGNGLYSLLGRTPVVLLTYQTSLQLLSLQASEYLTKNSPDAWIANLDQCLDAAWLARVEVVPYQSVGSRSILLGFRPDSITVMTEYGPAQTANVLIGIYNGVFSGGSDCQALLHPALITGVNTTKEAGICALPGR